MSDFLTSWRKERGRVIIFAGTFDPIHNGHLSAASQALKHNGGLVIFLPERVPTHKHGATGFEHRLAMVNLAVKNESRFIVINSPFDHHTITKTLPWVKQQFREDQNFGLLFGTDVAEHLANWQDISRLNQFGVDRIIFANRVTDSVFNLKPLKIKNVKIEKLRAENDHLTSTLVRQNFNGRASALPKSVFTYAKKHKLYDSVSSAGSK